MRRVISIPPHKFINIPPHGRVRRSEEGIPPHKFINIPPHKFIKGVRRSEGVEGN